MNKKKIINRYQNLTEKFNFNKKGMGWGKSSLDKRYSYFIKNLKIKNKNILDFGCGIGLFKKYLDKKKITIKNYYGLDINYEFTNYITQKYKKKVKVFNSKNQLVTNKLSVDVSISNGVHNYKSGGDLKNFFKDINFMISISKNAIGISFINNNVDFKENYLSYKNLNSIIKFLEKKKLKYKIDQTFNSYETFLFIYK